MSKKYTPDAECFDAANAASGGKLNRDEVNEAFQRAADYKRKLQSEGNIDGLAEKLKSFAEREAERTKVAAALARRHAALNILVRDRLDQSVAALMRGGLSPKKALLAVLEGTQAGIEGGRNSVAAMSMAYESRYLGDMFAEIQRDRPHLMSALRDPKLDADIMREMSELKEGGRPGITGNDDAKYVAKVFATYAELSRTDLNRLGASIGKLDGWAGAQTHDDIKMIAAGKDAWVSSVLQKLDIARTFPDLVDEKEIVGVLNDVYDTIITGFPNKPTPRETGQRVNPANLAKSLGKSRVLHFKDAESALAYRAEFGYGNLVSGMIGHLRNSARVAGNMEVLGPNPEVMFGAVVDSMKRRIKANASMTDAEKTKQINSLNAEAGTLRQSLDIATGLVTRPVNVTGAQISADIRAVQSMAKLGGAVLSSVADTVTPAIASLFRGSGFFRGLTAQLNGLRRGRPQGEFAEISYLIGEGFDGLIGHIVSPAAAVDGPVGRLAKLQETFFRWNGLSWWTDVQRATAGRAIAAEMGMRIGAEFDTLPAKYRHVLGLHGIDKTKWDLIRQGSFREVDGRTFVTPDRMRLLDDSVASADVRRDLEMTLRRFFADETSYAVVEPDARSRRTSTWGTRPGTMAGEAIRFVFQFKGFPLAFGNRVLGRALYGHRKGAPLMERATHIGALLAGMGMAGYMSMTMKDMVRGYWPPRNPADPKTWSAALVQGGALGIYGDFLFGRVNRFGGGLLATAAGPAIGNFADIGELILAARDGDASAADALTLAINNTPFVNLFYTRPALDFLFLNSLREAASPGYLRRQEKRRQTDYGQSTMPVLGDRTLLQ